MKLTWPTAIVIVVCVAANVTFAALGKEVPAWLTALAASIGTIAAGVMRPVAQTIPPSERDTDPDIRVGGQ